MQTELQTVSDLRAADGIRELDRRDCDGLSVFLLWDQTHDEILLAVTDTKTGQDTALGIPKDRALDAFRHPFLFVPNSAYADVIADGENGAPMSGR